MDKNLICPECGSSNLTRFGSRVWIARKLKDQYRCKDCGRLTVYPLGGLGQKVRIARIARRWTQDNLADEAQVTQGIVSALERGLPVYPAARARILRTLELFTAGQSKMSSESLTSSVEEAAQLLGIGRSLAYQEFRAGRLPGAIRIGRRLVVSRKKLEDYINKGVIHA